MKNPEVDVGIKDNTGRTAVHYAIVTGQQQLVKKFLPLPGIDTDDKDNDGNAMIHYACHFGQPEIVKLLLQRNPGSINQVNNSGETPLIMASRNSNLVGVNYFRRYLQNRFYNV